MTGFLKHFIRTKNFKKQQQKMIIIAIQDKFTLTKFLLIKYYVFVRVFCLELVCWHPLQLQRFPTQHLIMALKLFKLLEIFIWYGKALHIFRT